MRIDDRKRAADALKPVRSEGLTGLSLELRLILIDGIRSFTGAAVVACRRDAPSLKK